MNDKAEEYERNLAEKRRKFAEKFALGPTGQFPQGRIGPHDEGELKVAIGIEAGKIVVNLGKSIDWFAVTAEGARGLAAILIKKAEQLEKESRG